MTALLTFPSGPQVEDPSLRLRFLRNAESLSLLLGLLGDAGLKASRWRDATRTLLARPLDPEAVLQSIALSPEDRALFLTRLDSKDLSATVDQKTLVHLLLRLAMTSPTCVLSPKPTKSTT